MKLWINVEKMSQYFLKKINQNTPLFVSHHHLEYCVFNISISAFIRNEEKVYALEVLFTSGDR